MNLENDAASTYPSAKSFVLAPFLSQQYSYPPNVARRLGTDLLPNHTTNLYNLSDRLSPQYLFPPNEAFQQILPAFMPLTNNTSHLQPKTQQSVYHLINCSLLSQYLHTPNSTQICCV
mmetsp:Transcript_18405/g.28177  ORF Transcript_18405/g.28177 Transcript_18405/m.28177 type:complete len:118 (+) Transcript_18405:122-475(+)